MDDSDKLIELASKIRRDALHTQDTNLRDVLLRLADVYDRLVLIRDRYAEEVQAHDPMQGDDDV